MRSHSGSSLSTLAFLVPLLGVPLMAIFGVPQFVPVIASSVNDEPASATARHRSPRVGESAAEASFVSAKSSRSSTSGNDEQIDDLFRPTKLNRHDSRPLSGDADAQASRFLASSRSADTRLTQTSDERRESVAPAALSDLFGETLPSAARSNPAGDTTNASQWRQDERTTRDNSLPTATAAEHSTQGVTWRDAVHRLNDLGIQDFRLEPGRRIGEFYFACEFAPDRDARVTRRFEAEAKEPLLAVAAVLRQIDEWLPRR
jgi:hypothetical protein